MIFVPLPGAARMLDKSGGFLRWLRSFVTARLLPRFEGLYIFDDFWVCDEIVEELLPSFGGQACTFYHVGELFETV